MESVDRIRVLIADDDASLREVLADLIATDASLELVGVAENAEQAVELARVQFPDVVMLDVKMPGGGPRATREIRAHAPGTAVIALSAYDDETSVKEMLAGGASCYVVKGSPASRVLAAIHGSLAGEAVLSERVAAHVVTELTSRLEHERRQEELWLGWKMRIERVLRGEDELDVVFQPIVELESQRIVGVEALARFGSEPVRSPDVWFAKAAVVGLGLELELAAVERALTCLPLVSSDMFLSVNVSPDAIQSPLLTREIHAVDAERVVLEVTEHAPIKDYPGICSAIKYFRGRGARLAIDDAGAGYASLRHILHLAPDFIKLDITLTRDIQTYRPQRALASALVTFAREIGATITAEGIETPEELEVLRDLGVALGQGYLFGRPGPLPELRSSPKTKGEHDDVRRTPEPEGAFVSQGPP